MSAMLPSISARRAVVVPASMMIEPPSGS